MTGAEGTKRFFAASVHWLTEQIPSGRTLARAVLWACLGLNAAIVVDDLVTQRWLSAALQSIVVAGIAQWLRTIPTLDAWLDARLADALAHQRTSELMLAQFERMTKGGDDVRVSVKVDPSAPWMN